MNEEAGNAKSVEEIVELPHLADALEGEQFQQFLDHVPFGIAVSTLQGKETILYANLEFQNLTSTSAADVQGKSWSILSGFKQRAQIDDAPALDKAIVDGEEYIGAFLLAGEEASVHVDAWSNTILDDGGKPVFRLIALAAVNRTGEDRVEEFERKLQERDVLLRELQHRVKNNLQMITALIRLEARNLQEETTTQRFDRLAGRVEALALLYRSLSDEGQGESLDLGVYLSEIATSVMRAHAIEGIRLDLKIDTWPVSVNVAMPAGLVVNELMTNALKHAFPDGRGGEITLHSLADDTGCHIVIADNGIGLPDGMDWPKRGKLSAMIVQSLKQNANAKVDVLSKPGEGLRVDLFFARDRAAPQA
jgi:two-component sensor histidine kinase